MMQVASSSGYPQLLPIRSEKGPNMSRRKWFQTLVVTVVAAFLLVFCGPISAQGNRDDAFERVKEVQERHTNELMAKQGVVGTAVGLNDQGRNAVLVLLEKPGLGGIPQDLEGVPVHPVVTGKIEALKAPRKPSTSFDPTKWCERPVYIGVSTGNVGECSAGTIGCRLEGGYALSNNHVFAREGKADTGSIIVQPGLYDTKCAYASANNLGTLYMAVPISFSDTASNEVDAAVADVGENLGQSTPPGGYGIPGSIPVDAALNMQVQKYGRTSKLTTGRVRGLNATILVRYDSGVARFVNQIMIGSGGFSRAGDSGSLIVTQGDCNPVGLLFAGGSGATFANPITSVLEKVGMGIDGQ
jgi:hypothetical protein